MPLYERYGLRRPVTSDEMAEHRTARQMRHDFWRREHLYLTESNNRRKRILLSALWFLLLILVCMNTDFNKHRLAYFAFWVLGQIPLAYLYLRGRRGR